MSDTRIRVRANRSTGELEVEGSPELVAEWWEKLWPEMGKGAPVADVSLPAPKRQLPLIGTTSPQIPIVFGEYYSEFRSDTTDVDKVLIAGAFTQDKDIDRVFTTKNANQLLIEQNIKVGNASECVRRLVQARRAFVVSDGKFRVSASGFEHLKSLKVSQ